MLFFKVNNAGYVLGVEHVGNISDKDIEGMFATNVFGLISMTQLLVKGLQADSDITSILIIPFLCRLQSKEIRTRYQSWLNCRPRTICWWQHLHCYQACCKRVHRFPLKRASEHSHSCDRNSTRYARKLPESLFVSLNNLF